MKVRFLLLSVAALVGSNLAHGMEVSGHLTLEGRAFEDGPAYAGQDNRATGAVIFEPELYQSWGNGDLAFEFTPYFREDSADPERDLFDVRELSLLWISGNWETKIGYSKVFWGVAESQHLVDTINQTDLAANPDGEDKLGQPMVQIVYVSDFGDFSFFALPGFRERTFPGRQGRLRASSHVDTSRTRYESLGEDERVDFALRWKHYIGDFDLGLHYFSGTNRDPILIPIERIGGLPRRVIPYYELMDQVGLDVQMTKGAWLWKLEAIARETSRDRYSAMVGGFEYTLYGIMDSVVDLGLLAEVHLDSRGEAAPVVFNRDLFLGGRFAWNDEADTSMVAGLFIDGNNGSSMVRLEFERRIGDSYKLEIELQKLASLDEADVLYPLREDSYLQVSLSRYF
ncbi:hypothetical protein [Pelagicoccus sp. SDUM812003]|uniref:hypothetical protein n=1 Tax=Pelagicoccus sp. SDUM812003 TaxID=3041267 RepID=UPI0028100D1A|nr:hypothetical protein [Pelagicoccus sp. SDUM812003]MDQ8202432.1 hypothetical protein [Pelagicoccus sp. SDUM812003]